MVLLLMSCSVRSLKEAEPDKTSHGLSGFLYMEEVYAFARNNFSAGKFDEAIKWYERLDEDFPNESLPFGIFIHSGLYL
jgi:outer membrane protein assembly factor BamD (BamD/ComL family)